MTDPVNHPAHYTKSDIEPIAVIEAWELSFCLGNTVKYIARYKHKGEALQDLKKAAWYLAREIKNLESMAKKNRGGGPPVRIASSFW